MCVSRGKSVAKTANLVGCLKLSGIQRGRDGESIPDSTLDLDASEHLLHEADTTHPEQKIAIC